MKKFVFCSGKGWTDEGFQKLFKMSKVGVWAQKENNFVVDSLADTKSEIHVKLHLILMSSENEILIRNTEVIRNCSIFQRQNVKIWHVFLNFLGQNLSR